MSKNPLPKIWETMMTCGVPVNKAHTMLLQALTVEANGGHRVTDDSFPATVCAWYEQGSLSKDWDMLTQKWVEVRNAK